MSVAQNDDGRPEWSSVEWLSCGKAWPLYRAGTIAVAKDPGDFGSRISPSVEGALVTGDRKWLFVVQASAPSYGGAITPLGLGNVEITAVDPATSNPRPLTLARTHESAQSMLMAYDGGKLSLQWRDVGNGSTDERSFELCDLQAMRCEKVDDASPALAQSPDVMEVTAMATYAGRPTKGLDIGKSDVLARTVRASPSGDHVAFVTATAPDVDKDLTHLPALRTLWVHERQSGASRTIATGRSMFSPAWVSSHELVYAPEVELAKDLEPKIDEKIASIAADRSVPASADELARERALLIPLVAQAAMANGLPLERALRFPLRKLDARTGKDVEIHPGPASPFGNPSRPDLHHKGRTHEVPE